MESIETPRPRRKDEALLPPEQYEEVKRNWPSIEFNDEDQSFISKQGKKAYARKIAYFKPMSEEISQSGRDKWNDIRKDSWGKFLAALRAGDRVSVAAKKANLAYNTVKKRYRADPEFREQWDEAEAQAAEPVENAVFDAALNGNIPAAVKWLEKRAPERWPGDKVQIEQTNVYEIDASDRIGNIVALLARLQQRAELDSGPPVIEAEVIEPTD